MSASERAGGGSSLPPGIDAGPRWADHRGMSAALLVEVAPARSLRLLADVNAFGTPRTAARPPALDRLEAALGRELADRLVAALSERRADVGR